MTLWVYPGFSQDTQGKLFAHHSGHGNAATVVTQSGVNIFAQAHKLGQMSWCHRHVAAPMKLPFGRPELWEQGDRRISNVRIVARLSYVQKIAAATDYKSPVRIHTVINPDSGSFRYRVAVG